MQNDVIIHGNCVDVMREMPEGIVDLTVTSPPYDNLRTYEGYEFDFESIAEQLYRVTKPGGVVVWVVGDATIKGSETGTSFRQALHFKDIGFNLHDTMIWNKGSFTAVGALATRYAPVFEYMLVLAKGKLSKFNPLKDRANKVKGKMGGRLRKPDGSMVRMSTDGKKRAEYGQRFNIWNIAPCGGNSSGHPAPFPEQLASDHIITWSNPGDLILDPMCGSGTTCKVAALNNRHYIGIDISEKYVGIARERIRQHTQQMSIDVLL